MRIEYLQTAWRPISSYPSGIRRSWSYFQEFINKYKIDKKDIWDNGGGKVIVHIAPAWMDGRIGNYEAFPEDEVDEFLDVAMDNEIEYLIFS